MNRISDFSIGQRLETVLVVISATARKTKAGKPYLQLELFDGIDKISGNYWDWAGVNIPEVNAILDVTGQVTEWQGCKQLNIASISTNTEHHISEFAPTSGVDIGEVYKDAFALASNIHDYFLRGLSLSVLEALRSRWLEVPAAKTVHHAFVGGTLIHSLSVAKIALAISKQIPDSNDDLCCAGGLLHDIGKLYTYTVNGITVGMTDEGMLYDHVFMGAEFIGNFVDNLTLHAEDDIGGKLEMIRHIILSHHGKLEFGAAVPPMSIEAHIVNKADEIDSSVQQIIEASRKLTDAKFTERIYTLGNRPHLTPQYVRDTMMNEDDLPFK